MKTPKISHVIAEVSKKDSLDSSYQLIILVGNEYEDKISEQAKTFKDADLSSSHTEFYVRSIEELRSLMRPTSLYCFVIRSYLIYSFYKSEPSKEVYISSFGGNKISSSHAKNYLLHSILYAEDDGLLSHLVEMISGYQNFYDVQSEDFMLSDSPHISCRKQRIDDDLLIRSVFTTGKTPHLSNKDIITMMRDENMIPEGMKLKDEFIVLEPSQIVMLASTLINKKEEIAA